MIITDYSQHIPKISAISVSIAIKNDTNHYTSKEDKNCTVYKTITICTIKILTLKI